MPSFPLWPNALAAKAAGVLQSWFKTAPVPGPKAVSATIYAYTYSPPGSVTYDWNIVGEHDNDAYEGDKASAYLKARKWAKAATWPLCLEAHDLYPGTDGGPLYTLELDYMGARDRKTTGAAVLCVIGRSGLTPLRDPADMGVAHLDAYFRLVPYYYDFGKVKLDHFIRAEVKCAQAIISMQGGDRIRLSDDPAVGEFGFDPQTGNTGFWRGRLLLWGFNNSTGEQFSMREFPLPA